MSLLPLSKEQQGRFTLTYVIVGISVYFLGAWFGMLWFDVANHFDKRVPDFGYWTTFFLSWAVCNLIAPKFIKLDLLADYLKKGTL